MRCVDTDVLLRFNTHDDPEQSPAAQRFIEQAEEQGERPFVAFVALCDYRGIPRVSRIILSRCRSLSRAPGQMWHLRAGTRDKDAIGLHAAAAPAS